MEIHPVKISSRFWSWGYVLDMHTLSSWYLGADADGRQHWDTRRSAVGELLYQLKYRDDYGAVELIADTAAEFLRAHLVPSYSVDKIVPVPPSKSRKKQPVQMLALAIAERLDILCEPSCVLRTGYSIPAKATESMAERIEQQNQAFELRPGARTHGLRVLVLDDLYQTGASAEAVAALLMDVGKAAQVFYLAITKTRNKPT